MDVASKLDRYRYISTLGSGGMATVALAHDTLLGRPVALKRLTGAADARGLSRLRREALLGASVSHPNLVSIYDVVTTEDGELVLVMEYVRGETLRDRLIRQGRLAATESLRILEGVAAGLDAIHRRGIVHRDVKPANILIATDGTAKVADLGIASVPDHTRITTAGSVLGSFSYMAPEQLEDARSSPAMDVYALAAVAFEVLSGRKARPEANPMALAHAISTQRPPDVRDVWPGAPSAAAEVLIQGMARVPRARPCSAGELIGRLGSALEPATTAPIAPPEPPPTLSRDRPARAGDLSTSRPRGSAAATPEGARPLARDLGAVGTAQRRATRTGREQSRRLLAAGLLALVAAAVVVAVLLNTGGSQPRIQTRASAGRHSHRVRTGTPASAHKAATATSHHRAAGGPGSAATSTSAASTPAAPVTTSASTSAASASTSASTPAAATSPSASTPAGVPSTSVAMPAAPPPRPIAGSPISAVESFYGLAASHRYGDAWALADPTFRSELGGYQRFQGAQAGDRAISFDSARIVSQSPGSAVVAVGTTSIRNDGTQHCAGTVELRSAGTSARWLLHLIQINCS